ncbi:hypothetical protein DFJ66_7736 [Saccharothrix variisporea]|uniref:Uncharacterized protein n=1 Tax=Saccharothrix variisporea TaxID=543527 RepID=A0A495XJW2_9PSEU|nr:hypothetical protein DFJ66_7736 [Saccharothrix variisporea]
MDGSKAASSRLVNSPAVGTWSASSTAIIQSSADVLSSVVGLRHEGAADGGRRR